MHQALQATAHQSFDAPDEVREFPEGKAEILFIGGGEVVATRFSRAGAGRSTSSRSPARSSARRPTSSTTSPVPSASGWTTAPSSTSAPAR